MGDWKRTLEASFGANAGNIAEGPKVNLAGDRTCVNPERLLTLFLSLPLSLWRDYCGHTQASSNSSLRWTHMPQGGQLLFSPLL